MMILSSSTSSLIFLLIILGCHLLNGCFGRWTSIGLFHACLHEPLLYISACFILPNIECFIQPPNPSITIIIMYLFKTPSYIFDLRQILNISLNPHSIHLPFLLLVYGISNIQAYWTTPGFHLLFDCVVSIITYFSLCLILPQMWHTPTQMLVYDAMNR